MSQKVTEEGIEMSQKLLGILTQQNDENWGGWIISMDELSVLYLLVCEQ